MLGLGIIGCGRVTSMFHLKAIEQVEEIKVTAVSDINEERLGEIQHDCGVDNAYIDYHDLLTDDSVEAVAINTPPRFHEEMVKEALASGKHVLCEKPLAESVQACHDIKRLQEKTGLTVLPAHNYAFSPSLVLMEDFLRKGSIGKITDIKISFENSLWLYRSETDFRRSKENGIVEDVLPHVLSVVHPIVGHIKDVQSVEWWCKDYEVCDNMTAKLESMNGVEVDAYMSWTKLRPKFGVSVDGEAGRLFTDLAMNPFKLEVTINGEQEIIREKGVGWYLDLVKFKHPSFKDQYEHFYQLVKQGKKPKITISDEINILETIDKVSAKMV